MTTSDRGATCAAARSLHCDLLQWLLASAYPLWAKRGYDHERGGFHVSVSARPMARWRRIRAGAGAGAPGLLLRQRPDAGWQADPVPPITRGLEYFFARYRRPDGLFRYAVCRRRHAAR